MAKQKSHRGAAKRFRVTRTGKLLHRRANKAHMLTKKSGSRKRRLEQTGEITVEKRSILRLLRKR
ncbi:MAG TPA: 50S ribosomal protein L35 [Actinomycetota bacterium]|jgi:large subunit ribosomal protein L35|nr:50S ribosomal protein L35 [Actinomycetota bacterium]